MSADSLFDGATVPMTAVVAFLIEALDTGEATIAVADPDRGAGRPAGATVPLGAEVLVHRPWAVWTDLAGRLGCRMSTPERLPRGRCQVRFTRCREGTVVRTEDPRERYGAASWFAAVDKREDPVFVLDLRDALARADLPDRPCVWFLGVNRGDEVALLRALLGRPFDAIGIDHSASALAVARERFPDGQWIEADLQDLARLALPSPDLVVAIDVLHSPSIDDQGVLRDVIASLGPRGTICIGVPNCTYVGGERVPGARIRNLAEPELALLVKRVAHYRRHLHRHGFRVYVTGTHEVLVTGVR